MTAFIGLHIGAGYHSVKKENQYKTLCNKACQAAMEILIAGGDSLQAAVEATKVLEDSVLTNAGRGANLTLDGNVECDACVMEGRSMRFGAVGALPSILNPITVARALCESQKKRLSLGRIHPCLLVGQGALQFAAECNIPQANPTQIISEKSKRIVKKYKDQLESSNIEEAIAWQKVDTVGAVAVDLTGTVSSCCSSGGVLLKRSGRVGQAAIYGCGCWAENGSQCNTVGVSISGTGEDIIKTTLSKEVARSLKTSDFPVLSLDKCLNQTFLESPYLGNDCTRICGVIAVLYKEGSGEFLWGHTSQSFGIAYMSSKQKKPIVRISRLPKNVKPGTKVSIEGVTW
ncbi:threonine aspartase 1 isoform X1 [Cimex lectularius]|uniref:Threonine aspartase 1 n=1 Tax=Cimex lectularius TaxID=79782 RepID=A0A8I6RY05_CIMLE|nr:threonine aspartase 1 isoform X1 [Cimex lectularius]XP_014252094.1 threonine aspartase 1 isoform X1 [Cimex lectularius]XP_014252095.1 threonine aspartase 1 isoform X1 [Cimex lectularius]